MHATYLFWIPTNYFDTVVDCFYLWISEKGDENNWFELLCAINERGDRKNLATPGDWRGRDKEANHLLKKVYGNDRRSKAEEIAEKLHEQASIWDLWRFAWICIANEFAFDYGSLIVERKDIASCESYLEFVRKIENSFKTEELELDKLYMHFLKRLDKLFNVIKTIKPKSRLERQIIQNFKINVKRLKKTAKKKMPFARTGNPYNYRCFDLTRYCPHSLRDGQTILAVDIHI